jgi:hypothetical protein
VNTYILIMWLIINSDTQAYFCPVGFPSQPACESVLNEIKAETEYIDGVCVQLSLAEHAESAERSGDIVSCEMRWLR